MKKAVFVLLILLCIISLILPVYAADESGETEQVVDASELDAMLAPYLESFGATEKNFGLAFLYTGTGETYYINRDFHVYSASLYKVPVCMRYAEKVSSGELSWDTRYNGATLDWYVMRSLVYSDNNTAGTLILKDADILYGKTYFGFYSGFSQEELEDLGAEYIFTPRFMLNTMQTLYEDPERFPKILDYLKEASPGSFFRKKLEGQYEIAQKYGQYEGKLHTAGVIYTPTPILLVVMCDHMPDQLEAISTLAEIFADYSLILDTRLELLRSPAETPEPPEPVEESPQDAPVPESQAEGHFDENPKSGNTEVIIILCLSISVILLVVSLLMKKKLR